MMGSTAHRGDTLRIENLPHDFNERELHHLILMAEDCVNGWLEWENPGGRPVAKMTFTTSSAAKRGISIFHKCVLDQASQVRLSASMDTDPYETRGGRICVLNLDDGTVEVGRKSMFARAESYNFHLWHLQ